MFIDCIALPACRQHAMLSLIFFALKTTWLHLTHPWQGSQFTVTHFQKLVGILHTLLHRVQPKRSYVSVSLLQEKADTLGALWLQRHVADLSETGQDNMARSNLLNLI